MRLRIGEGCVSGGSRCEGLKMAGLGKLGGKLVSAPSKCQWQKGHTAEANQT